MGQTWRNGGQPSDSLQQPQLRRPIHQGPTQPLDIRVAGSELGFDGRDLPPATCDSCRLPTLGSDRVYCVVSRHIVGTA